MTSRPTLLARSALATAALAVLAAACSTETGPGATPDAGSQDDPDTDGEVDAGPSGDPDPGDVTLPNLHGTVTNDLEEPPAELEVRLVWLAEEDAAPADAVAITGGTFPATFELDVAAVPDETILNDFTRGGAAPDETRIGVAMFVAAPPGADSDPEGTAYGLAEKHILVYLETDVKAGTESADLVGGALPAGFHLMDVVEAGDPACPGEGRDCLREAADGLDAAIEVRLDDLAAIDVPNWT